MCHLNYLQKENLVLVSNIFTFTLFKLGFFMSHSTNRKIPLQIMVILDNKGKRSISKYLAIPFPIFTEPQFLVNEFSI